MKAPLSGVFVVVTDNRMGFVVAWWSPVLQGRGRTGPYGTRMFLDRVTIIWDTLGTRRPCLGLCL